MASVKLTNVKKVYDNNVVAVHDFNLDIKDKEFVVFVGPSGCGKSTRWSTTCSPRIGTSPWSSRTTLCTRT